MLIVSIITATYLTGSLSANNSGIEASSSLVSESNEILASQGTYADGIYQGSGIGFRGRTTTVSVTVSGGKITDIQVLSYGDDTRWFSRAYYSVAEQILNSQSTEVDAVSGATYSSLGIMEAVENALNTGTGEQKAVQNDNLNNNNSYDLVKK